MKVERLYVTILLCLLLPAQILMLKKPIYPSHDALYHIERINQFHQSLTLGQIPPRLAPTIINGLGYPLFVVNYQLPYYFAEIFMFPTQNPIFAFKATMSISYLLSGIFAFLLFKNFGSNTASLVGALLFNYLPYRFANLYTRGSLGESFSLMFIPLVLLAIHQISKKNGLAVLLLVLAIFGLITSHTVIFILFIPFFIVYTILLVKLNLEAEIKIVFGFILGILMSSFQLVPSIFEKKYLKFDQNLIDLYKSHFINFAQLLRIPLKGINTGTTFQIGLISTFVILLSLIFFIRKRNLYLIFFLAFSIISIFATQKISLWFWKHFPLLYYILYPWRFLSIVLLSTAYLSVYLVDQFKHKRIIAGVLILFTFYTSRHYFLKPTQFESNLPTATLTTQNENDPIWSNSKTFIPRPLITSNSNIKIFNVNEKPFDVSFEAETDKTTNIVLRRMYFPGWKVKANDQEKLIIISDGLISFDLKPGSYQVKTYFIETPLRKTANLMTFGSFSILLSMFLLKLKFTLR